MDGIGIGIGIGSGDPNAGGTFVEPPAPMNTNLAWSDGTTIEWFNAGGNINMEWSG